MAISDLELVALRHSWSVDALRMISPSAAISSGLGTLEATVAAPEIYWSSSAAAIGKAEVSRPLRRQMWQGGDLAVGVNMGYARIHVRPSRKHWRPLQQSLNHQPREDGHNILLLNAYKSPALC